MEFEKPEEDCEYPHTADCRITMHIKPAETTQFLHVKIEGIISDKVDHIQPIGKNPTESQGILHFDLILIHLLCQFASANDTDYYILINLSFFTAIHVFNRIMQSNVFGENAKYHYRFMHYRFMQVPPQDRCQTQYKQQAEVAVNYYPVYGRIMLNSVIFSVIILL